MKRIFKRLFLYGFLLVLAAVALGYLFQDKLQVAGRNWGRKIVRDAIQNYGHGLPPVDEVKLMLLSSKDPGKGLGSYYVRQSEPSTLHITQEVLLTGAEAQELAALWRQLRLHDDYMAGCFDPHHVVQFRSRGSVIADTVICFGCGNTSLPGFPIRPILNFESIRKKESPDYLEFRAKVEKLVGAAP